MRSHAEKYLAIGRHNNSPLFDDVMDDQDCIHFLQWALPQLHMRWAGFRRVHQQVCKRLQRRLNELGLPGLAAYQHFLERNPTEWAVLDECCRITISRFYRDKAVFAFLGDQVFPYLIQQLQQRQENILRVWCAGCGAGEEPYSLALSWEMQFKTVFPTLSISLVGTDINPDTLERAYQACYPYSSVKNLPSAIRVAAFAEQGGQYCLAPEYRSAVDFRCQDLRHESPKELFHLILCRNLAFTYFDDQLQHEVAQLLHARLMPGGVLLIGVHEKLPDGGVKFKAWSERLGIYLAET